MGRFRSAEKRHWHRAVDACNECGEAEQDTAHKIATASREKNDVLIVNLSSLR